MSDERPIDPLQPTHLFDEKAVQRARAIIDAPPEQIGPYRIIERIGGGGMGEVYRAEQRSPIRREVALKFIKLGMDTKAVIARFEAERQALALMDHPHIAKVLDAGTDDTGRPFFVMEYVKGKPITDYADKQQLTIAERLELMEQVCQAIQHAHHKGVIHRDLKPTNVLVSTHDGKPFAKVIDFGIAKAIGQQLTDKTLFTLHDQFIGTPQYMSPEQAEGSLDIDTRTDVYSLGVLMYELLTGTPPFSTAELKQAAWDQFRKRIMEVDPPKPSTRLSESGEVLATLATSRRTEPKRLGSLVRGELDWIVMKALEKDRKRRYETPTGLAADIKRHLEGEPVQAAPPSRVYQLQKFVKRNKSSLLAGTAILGTLVCGIIGTGWGLQTAINSNHKMNSLNEHLVVYSKKLEDAYARYYAEYNLDDGGEPWGKKTKSTASFPKGYRIDVDYTSVEPTIRTWIDSDADPKAARLELADNISELLLFNYRADRQSKRDLIAARDKAERFLAEGILRPIAAEKNEAEGFSLSNGEVKSHHDWCALPEFRLRFLILKTALEQPEIAIRIARRAPWVVHAVSGIDPSQRKELRAWLAGRQQDQSVEPQIRMAAVTLALAMTPAELPVLRETLTVDNPFLGETCQQLHTNVENLTSNQVLIAADTLLETLRKTDDQYTICSARDGLIALSPRLTNERLDLMGRELFEILHTSEDRHIIAEVGLILATLVPRLPDEQMPDVWKALIKTQNSNADNYTDEALGKGFEIVARRLSANRVDDAWDELIQMLPKLKNNAVPPIIGRVLAVMVSRLTDNRIGSAWESLNVEFGKKTDFATAEVLLALADRLTSAQAAKAWGPLVSVLRSSKEEYGPQTAGEILAVVARHLPPDQIDSSWNSLVELLHTLPDYNLPSITTPLAAVAYRLSSDRVAIAGDVLEDRFNASGNYRNVEGAIYAWYKLAPLLPSDRIVRASDKLVEFFNSSFNSIEHESFKNTLLFISPRLPSDKVTAIWDRLVEKIRESENKFIAADFRVPAAQKILASLANHLQPNLLNVKLDEMIETLISSTDEFEVDFAIGTLTMLAPRLSSNQVTIVWDRLVEVAASSKDWNVRHDAPRAIAALLPLIPADKIGRAIDDLSSLEIDGILKEHPGALRELLSRSTSAQQEQLCAELIRRLNSTNGARLLRSLAEISPVLSDENRRKLEVACWYFAWAGLMEDPVRLKVSTDTLERWQWHDASAAVEDVITIASDSRQVAVALLHPQSVSQTRTATDIYQTRLLERFEELIYHNGKQLWTARGLIERWNSDHPKDQKPLDPSLANLPERKFKTVDDAALWIQQNWPDFDLSARYPLE